MWLGHIFYAIGLIPLLMLTATLIKLREYNKIKKWYNKFEEVTKKKPIKGEFRTPDEYNLFAGVSGIIAIDLVWMLLGLLTQSWYVFLAVLSLSIVLNLTKKLIGTNIISNSMTAIVLFVKISIYLYLIINHFHLHYNTWQLVQNYIK